MCIVYFDWRKPVAKFHHPWFRLLQHIKGQQSNFHEVKFISLLDSDVVKKLIQETKVKTKITDITTSSSALRQVDEIDACYPRRLLWNFLLSRKSFSFPPAGRLWTGRARDSRVPLRCVQRPDPGELLPQGGCPQGTQRAFLPRREAQLEQGCGLATFDWVFGMSKGLCLRKIPVLYPTFAPLPRLLVTILREGRDWPEIGFLSPRLCVFAKTKVFLP